MASISDTDLVPLAKVARAAVLDGAPVQLFAQVAAAVMTLTMPAVAGQRNYLCGFWVDGTGATAASVIEGTITGGFGGTARFEVNIPAGAGLGITPVRMEFVRPFISAVNVALVITIPSFGVGNLNAVAALHGYVA